MKSLFCTLALVAGLIFSTQGMCLAQDIPAEMKATFYTKMFSLIHSLDHPHVSIIYAAKETKQKDKLAREFQKLGVTVTSFVEADAAQAEGNVIFLLSRVSEDTAKQFSNCGRLVLADRRDLVETGDVTFSLAPYKGKVKLWANLTHIKNNKLAVKSTILSASKTVG